MGICKRAPPTRIRAEGWFVRELPRRGSEQRGGVVNSRRGGLQMGRMADSTIATFCRRVFFQEEGGSGSGPGESCSEEAVQCFCQREEECRFLSEVGTRKRGSGFVELEDIFCCSSGQFYIVEQVVTQDRVLRSSTILHISDSRHSLTRKPFSARFRIFPPCYPTRSTAL